ncbi:hypothetical protein HHL16_21585 [Pseudoflavitalea sp. G-6-1-2]|uniref:hypothetical protein n=1 Tax=Pseudoflavitalea sp. G-6-1-2 TaxID=2728841 RepID=UPI00146DD028|nr:hypothetical protein [Pseudoflavitalea sp. G-6-1-2]NML23487.1 hypothetical protein [Pseudoflavitalea sp. G-6-1-2]
MSEFITYQKFYNQGDAEAFAAFLDVKNIPFELERQRAVLDPIYIGEQSEPTYIVKIAPEQFEKVNVLMKEEAAKQLDSVPADYYLFEFTDDELKNVLTEANEWSQLDVLLAEKLLKTRGVPDAAIPLEALVAPYQPARIGTWALVAGYICCGLFPVYSIPMGVVVMVAKKTLPDGTRIPMYDKWSYNHGLAITVIGTLIVFSYLGSLLLRGGWQYYW